MKRHKNYQPVIGYCIGLTCYACNMTEVQSRATAEDFGDFCFQTFSKTPTKVCGSPADKWRCSEKKISFTYERGGKQHRHDQFERNCREKVEVNKRGCKVYSASEAKMEVDAIVSKLSKSDVSEVQQPPAPTTPPGPTTPGPTTPGTNNSITNVKAEVVRDCQCNKDRCNSKTYSYDDNGGTSLFREFFVGVKTIGLFLLLGWSM